MSSPENLAEIVIGLGFMLAVIFGAVAQRANFCTMGSVVDAVTFGDWRRMRMWLLAIAVAMIGVALLQDAGLIDTAKTLYTGSRIAVLSMIVGGFIFGFGMTLASGCGSKTLIRIGGGSLKSLIVLVFIGISAYMSLKGLFALWRSTLLDPIRVDVGGLGAATSDLPTLAVALGVPAMVKTIIPFAFAAVILAFVFRSREFRGAREMVFGGFVIGSVIVAGYFVSGYLGHFPEDPRTLEESFVATNSGRMESMSFIAPVAYLFELLVYWTDKSRMLTFGIASVLGVIAGAAGMAIATKTFRWEGFTTTEDLVHHIVGGILMGFGGVTALGCTIGQGISGVSTLALGSFVAFFSIIGGSIAAIRYQMWRIERSSDGAPAGKRPVNAPPSPDVSAS